MKKCISYCTASKYDFKELISNFENNYKLTKHKNVAQIEYDNGLYFIFDYGVVVTWSSDYNNNKNILDQIKQFEVIPNNDLMIEELTFDDKSGISKISNDCIYLSGDSNEEKLAISHGLAQSVKLNFFEYIVEKSIIETRNIPQNLAETGNIKLSSHKISKMRGELFLTKSRINLHYDLLDTPEYFWEYPELSKYYEKIANYLEVQSRIEVLNKKLEVIHELLQMLADEQKHKHSSFLEWIIIRLIGVEIFFTIFHDVLEWF